MVLVMSGETILSLAAIMALLPAALSARRTRYERDAVFWALLAAATAGPMLVLVARTADGWRGDFATAMWLTVTATMLIFAAVAILTDHGWRLTPVLTPYLALLAVFATSGQGVDAQHAPLVDDPWTGVHIAFSISTYAMLTIAAVGALAAFQQERALKTKKQTALTRVLPTVVECDRLFVRLLVLSAAVLAIGLATGIATNIADGGPALPFDHKTVLSLAAFAVIAVLLILHFRTGLRGRAVARAVLFAYLLLTLGYPGVKFVTDVLLA